MIFPTGALPNYSSFKMPSLFLTVMSIKLAKGEGESPNEIYIKCLCLVFCQDSWARERRQKYNTRNFN